MANNNVQYKSNAKEVKKTLTKLEKTALRETGKFLRKAMKKAAPKDEGVLRKNIGSWVRGKAGEDPVLQIGVYDRARARKKGYPYAYHAHLVQFGTIKMPATDFLRGPVFNNISDIREIQAEYIRQIKDIEENGIPDVGDEEGDD